MVILVFASGDGAMKSFLCVLLCCGTAAQAASVLSTTQWSVQLDPATLALAIARPGQGWQRVSEAGEAHTVSALEQDGRRVRWEWDGGRWRFEAALAGADLTLTVAAREPGELVLIRQPAAALGRGLILPLREGSFVPASDARWRAYLLAEARELDGSEDLGLPLWGMLYDDYSLSWILTQPFDSTLRFSAQGQGLGLTLTQRFSPLAPGRGASLLLHLGAGADPLAGALRYRRWLIGQQRWVSLADKIRRWPAAGRLPGASHVYLWDNGVLAVRDVRNWERLLVRLRDDSALSRQLRAGFDGEALRALRTGAGDAYRRRVLTTALNRALAALARDWQRQDDVDWHALGPRYVALRAQLARHFGAALAPDPGRWGGGVSRATVAALRAGGLPRLWLGSGDGWEAGLWHPEAVAAAVAAGYLAAPYDSYETALGPGGNPDWSTAWLGGAVARRCGIIGADGRPQAGFGGQGYYTNPVCVRATLQRRIGALRAAAGYNSWFLDAYATGMVFDDHRAGRELARDAMARENDVSMQWVGDQGLAVGSENGNAVAAASVVFAHGMQQPLFGWHDPELHRDTRSPSYLGAWYPEDEPAVFFRRATLKSPYRELFYDAASRLPLYQAVFHDSLISGNHWLADNLKFGNVAAEVELAQLLYNVPPLYHLSTGTLARRLPAIVRHDRFFRPLHQRLATVALTGFVWHSADRRLQETRFADGTRLLANFGTAPAVLDGTAVPARGIVARIPGQAPQVYRSDVQ